MTTGAFHLSPFPPISYPVLIGPERSRARFGAAERTLDGEDRSGIVQGEGKGGSKPLRHELPTKNPEYPI
jgi:hypothetical protein